MNRSKIYWHIQMSKPQGRNGKIIDSSLMLKEKKPIIGTGEWDDIQCRHFKGENNGLKKGDIVLVREGNTPLALVQVSSDFFQDENLKKKYLHIHYRKVKILDWYNGYEKFPQPQGTLQRLINNNNSREFIDSYYNRILKDDKMESIKRLLKYKKQIILQGPPGTGKTREAKIIAQELIGLKRDEKLNESAQFKLIQFHPSYTYEDFVRGITAKPNETGEGIVYEAENKSLAEFADRALENYKESQESGERTVLIDKFKAFVNYVIEAIDKEEKFDISEKIYIYSVEESRFKYKGDGWTAHPNGLNMNFSQLKKILELGLSSRQEINRCEELSSLARQHATYYHNVIQLYKNFVSKLKPQKEKVELKNYVLIIDEINRANLSSVLGELIYALEYRGKAVDSMYAANDSKELILPPNLFIIGTMNTADRSIGHIDYAIRRRFAFVEMLPKSLEENDEIYFNREGFDKVSGLFNENNVSPEFECKDVQIGHSYFIVKKKEVRDGFTKQQLFNMKMQYEVIPILLEYVNDGVLKGDVDGQSIKDYIVSLKNIAAD